MTVEEAIKQAVEHHRAGRLREAETIYRRILAQDPTHSDALHLLGRIAQQVGQHDAAAKLFSQAVKVNPEIPAYHHDLATSLGLLGRHDESIAEFQRTIELSPQHAGARCNLGIALSLRGRFDEAIKAFTAAVALNPNLPELYVNFATTLSAVGRHTDAGNALAKAIGLRPDYAAAHSSLGITRCVQGRAEEAIAAFRKTIEIDPSNREAHSNLLVALNYVEHDRRSVFQEHLGWGERFAAPLSHESPPCDNERDPQRRIRIGYVSGDFWSHAIGFFIEPALANHDRDGFEVFCYSDVVAPDDLTQRLQNTVDHWRPIVGMSDEQVAQMIRQDRIDILIDLAGHTAGNRMLVFARKPAPIQVTYLGYPNTTGMKAMDYRITDALSDPPGEADAFYTERLIRLPRCAWCYRPPMEDSPATRARKSITFGSFNNFAKVTPRMIKIWAQLLQRIPQSRLILKSIGLHDVPLQQSVRDAFTTHGIAPERLDIRGATATLEEHLHAYADVDVAIDTFPYNGTTTTCEALWMAVPVVTLAGDTHTSRVGLSLLTNIGAAEWIARDAEDYIEIAAKLAENPAIRSDLRERMRGSPLMDAVKLTRDLEASYRSIWREWCSSPT